MKIEISCPSCGKLCKVDDSNLSGTCPHCDAELFDVGSSRRSQRSPANYAKYAAVMSQNSTPKVQDVRVVKIDLSFWNILCLSFAFGIAFGIVMLAGRLIFG